MCLLLKLFPNIYFDVDSQSKRVWLDRCSTIQLWFIAAHPQSKATVMKIQLLNFIANSKSFKFKNNFYPHSMK